MNFDDLQAGDHVFLDANIFIYHFLGKSADCRQLLSRCHQGALKGITASFIVAEVTHRLMTAEAVARQLVTSSQVVKNCASALTSCVNCRRQISVCNKSSNEDRDRAADHRNT